MSAPNEAGQGEARDAWTLDPGITYLNHGSFGACPRVVQGEQARLRERLEREPVRFLVREAPSLFEEARAALAGFVGAEARDLVLVANATTGVNAVLRSLRCSPGDELLTTDHAYNACRNVLDFVAESAGARVTVAALPFPLASPSQAVEAIAAAVGPRTRLALIDHVTSQTGLVLPIEDILRAIRSRGLGVHVLVDGAHAPGMVPLDLARLAEAGADSYTGNCHKWICAPKGAGFLWVRRDHQAAIRPTVVSHGANSPLLGRPGAPSRYQIEFDWAGTVDPTAALCVPAALRFLDALMPGGWRALQADNRAKVLAARALLCEALGVPPPCPESMIGALASVPLPDAAPGETPSALGIDPLQDALFHEHAIEVPVMPWPRPPHRLLRISAQRYNRPEEYSRLAGALRAVLERRQFALE